MISEPTISIKFYIDGKQWASKLWSHVPRVGEEVMLGAGRQGEYKADTYGKAAFKIVRVVWGVEQKTDNYARIQCVNIAVEHLGEKP